MVAQRLQAKATPHWEWTAVSIKESHVTDNVTVSLRIGQDEVGANARCGCWMRKKKVGEMEGQLSFRGSMRGNQGEQFEASGQNTQPD